MAVFQQGWEEPLFHQLTGKVHWADWISIFPDGTPDGKWGDPENLGSTINTRYNEETPFITNDGNRLYFSSYGHYNMGGYDIFYSTRNDRWLVGRTR